MRMCTSFSQRLLFVVCLCVLASTLAQSALPTQSTPAPIKRPANAQSKPPATVTPKATAATKPPDGAAKPPAGKTAAVKTTPTPTPKPGVLPVGTQDPKPELTAEQLLEQGKVQYKAGKFPQALAKFEAALKVEPERDDALGLAADL